VIFLGFQQKPEIIKLFLKGDIYIQPSRQEGLGLAFMEAQAFGLPIITSNFMSIPYFVNKNNFMIEMESTDQLKKSMIKLIEDRELRKKIGKNNKKYARRFDYNVIRKIWLNMVRDVLEV
jgi:glycosyltransferase involved in cell wall biosynthesis